MVSQSEQQLDITYDRAIKELWAEAFKLTEKSAMQKIEKYLPDGTAFRKFLEKLI